jgi:Fungal specific transcription factor domain
LTEDQTPLISQSQADFDLFFNPVLSAPDASPGWDPFAPSNIAPFVSFPDTTLDQNWAGIPLTSLSPLSSTPHIPWGFEHEQGAFSLSVASSPRSQNAVLSSPVRMQSIITGSVPYPLPWDGHRDRYGGLELEGLLEEQQLGIYLSLKTKQHYVEAYWKHFHPLFPILHRHTYQMHKSNPLFSAAVMAVGAQYCDRGFAKSDSRILHGKCQELISKVSLELRGLEDLL